MGDNCYTARKNYIKYHKSKHAKLTKNTYKNQHKKLKQGLVTSYDMRPGNEVKLFW